MRFIPAGAGNTTPWQTQRPPKSVHPRGCGEHLNLAAANSWRSGSSPRVRGTLFLVAVDLSSTRFIPAGAGNTRKTPRYCYPGSVHPRGCGEHTATAHRRICRAGSSPRVRGTLNGAKRVPDQRRFIPAGAGNTNPVVKSNLAKTVHPRGCGEHFNEVVRMSLDVRFIPAGAGNTTQKRFSLSGLPVHPRGCGEHNWPGALPRI